MKKIVGLIGVAIVCLIILGIAWYMNNGSVITLNELTNLTQEEMTHKLIGIKRDKIVATWGEPVQSLSGMYGDIYEVIKNEKNIIIYYNSQSRVTLVKIVDNNKTTETTEYTLEQLQAMALDYYEMKNGTRPQNTGAVYDENNPDMVIIQLYDNLGDHNSNADWYTVNKYTAVGTNAIGNEIDLKEGNK